MLQLLLNGRPVEFNGGALKFVSDQGILLTYRPFDGRLRPGMLETWTAEWQGFTAGGTSAQHALDNLATAGKAQGVVLP